MTQNTKPEIAERLLIDRRTVTTLRSTILRELGIANRIRLAGDAAGHGA